jgi:integrase
VPRSLPKYVKAFTDNRGKKRYYYRRNGYKTVPLPAPWDEGFLQAYSEASSNKAPVSKTHVPASGTLGAVIVHYLGSAEYQQLAAQTQATYRRLLDRLRRDAGGDRVVDFLPMHIQAMIARRAKDGGPEAGNSLRRMLKLLFRIAVELGLRTDDPTEGAKKVKRPRGAKAKAGYRTWTDADIDRFIERYPLGTREYLALCLMLYTGQRRSDVVKLGPKSVKGAYDPTNFSGRKLAVMQQKTSRKLVIPIHPRLGEALALANIPADAPAFLLTQYGKAFVAQGFTNYWIGCSRKAGIEEQASPHGLRYAAARKLAEAGCSMKMIGAITGHTALKELQRYTNAADQERLAEQAMALMIADTISRPKGSPQPT